MSLKEAVAVIRGRTIMPNCKGNVPRAGKQKYQTRENHPVGDWKRLRAGLRTPGWKQSLLPRLGLEFRGWRGSRGVRGR